MLQVNLSPYARGLQTASINANFECGETPAGSRYLDAFARSLVVDEALSLYIKMLEDKIQDLGGDVDEVINAHKTGVNNENPV